MATSIVCIREKAGNGVVFSDLYGASGLGASDDGYWIYVGDLDRISIHFSGISGDTCQIFGANVKAEPADASDYWQMGGDVTTDAIVAVEPVRWLKCKHTHSAGTAVHAWMHAQLRR